MESNSNTLSDLVDSATDFTVATLILAVLTAFFLQAAYEFGARRWINRYTTARWLQRRLRFARSRDEKLWEKLIKLESKEIDVKRPFSWRNLLLGIGITPTSAILSLPYPQFCAQIGTSIQNAIDYSQAPTAILSFSLSAYQDAKQSIEDVRVLFLDDAKDVKKDESSESDGHLARQRIAFRADRSIDELQSELARKWSLSSYLASFVVSIVLLLVLYYAPTPFSPGKETLWFVETIIVASALLAPPIQSLIDRILHPR